MKPRNIGGEIRSSLLRGERPIDIAKRLSCSKTTITYHAKKIGLDIQNRPDYDWKAINDFHNDNHSLSECMDKFGFCRASWHKALKRGDVVTRPLAFGLPLDILLTPGIYRGRHNVKRRLLKEGLIENKCALCGITEWRGKPLAFNLDHADGDKFNWALINLRMVCPNCDSQQDTFAGKNNIRLRLQAELLFGGGVTGNTSPSEGEDSRLAS